MKVSGNISNMWSYEIFVAPILINSVASLIWQSGECESDGRLCRRGAGLGFDGNLRLARLYGRPEVTRDRTAHGIGGTARRYSETDLDQGGHSCRRRNYRWRNPFRIHCLDDVEFAVRRSAA